LMIRPRCTGPSAGRTPFVDRNCELSQPFLRRRPRELSQTRSVLLLVGHASTAPDGSYGGGEHGLRG
jgi:hypothetical protein